MCMSKALPRAAFLYPSVSLSLSSYRKNTSTLSTEPLLLVLLLMRAFFPSTAVSLLHMHTFIKQRRILR